MHRTFFLDFRVYFMQLFFMNEARKCPNHTESEYIQLLRHCRDSMESWPSPRHIQIIKKMDTATSSQLSDLWWISEIINLNKNFFKYTVFIEKFPLKRPNSASRYLYMYVINKPRSTCTLYHIIFSHQFRISELNAEYFRFCR